MKIFVLFRRELQRIHVIRLENDNEALGNSLAAKQEQLLAATAEAEQLRVALKEMQAKLEQKEGFIVEQARQINVLETSLEIAQDELLETKQRVPTGVVERVIRFFTCCSLASSSPPTISTKSPPGNRSPGHPRTSSRKLSSEYKDADEMTSPVDDDEYYGDEEVMKTKKVLF